MLHSVTAQAASTRWRIHTLVLLVIMLTTHIACFAVLTQQVTSRYECVVHRCPNGFCAELSELLRCC